MILFLLPILCVHTCEGVHTKNIISCFDLTGQNRKEREQKKNGGNLHFPLRGKKNNKGIKLKEMDKLFQLQIQLDYSSHLCSQVHVSCLAFTLYCFFQKKKSTTNYLTYFYN
jgi:hypothetical protein